MHFLVNKAIISLVIGMVVNAIKKFEQNFNWALLKKDLEEKVRHLIPGEWFDDAAVMYVHWMIDTLDSLLDGTDTIKIVLEKLAAQDWAGAVLAIKQLLAEKVKLPGASSVDLDEVIAEAFKAKAA